MADPKQDRTDLAEQLRDRAADYTLEGRADDLLLALAAEEIEKWAAAEERRSKYRDREIAAGPPP